MTNRTTRQTLCPARDYKVVCETPMACGAQCRYAGDPVHPNRVEVPASPTTTGLRVIVCGGRSYDDRSAVYAALDRLHSDTPLVRLIHGAATGADTLAHEWAVERGIMDEAFPANWEKNGRAAGPLRNKAMIVLGKPHLVVAFPGGHGTADMVRRARAAGIEVWKPLEEAYA